MRKILLSLVVVCIGFAASAQTKAVKIGIKAGVNFPTFSGSDLDVSLKTNTSFYHGGTVNIPLSSKFSVQPGLTLGGKGSKIENSETEYSSSHNVSLIYLELPVNAIVNFSVGNGNLFIGAGSY